MPWDGDRPVTWSAWEMEGRVHGGYKLDLPGGETVATVDGMDPHPADRTDHRTEIRGFLAGRRAKITPERAGLPTSGRRRVPGLRREEVAVLAGVSTEWYTRLEKGHISGVSEEVLAAVAQALQLDEDERTYLFDLARAARTRPARRAPSRRGEAAVPPRVQWLLDSMTLSSAFVRNGRQDVIAHNALAQALHTPVFDTPRPTGTAAPTSPATSSSTPARGTSSSTGTPPPRPPPRCCAPRPDGSRMTGSCAS